MKILWVSHVVPYPPKRGVLLRAYHLVRELAKHHEVHLVCLNQKALIEPYLGEYVAGTEKAKAYLEEYCASVNIIDAPLDSGKYAKPLCALSSLIRKNPYTVNWLWSRDFYNLIGRIQSEEQCELVHFDTVSLAEYLDSVEAAYPAKYSLGHHNIESDMLMRRAGLESNLLKRFYYKQEGSRLKNYEKRVCSKFHTNITVSDLDSERLASIVEGAKTFVAENSVDIDFFKPSPKDNTSATFLFVGTLSWYPNEKAIRYAAENLWQNIKQKYPQAEFNVIGANPPKDLVEFSQKNEGFNILGFVDDLTEYFDNATIYLCPIKDGGGTKLKLLDAFSSGMAVVADPIACEGLKVTDGENVLLASSPDSYLQSISEILENETLRLKLRLAARKHAVENFSSRAIGASLANHFAELCKETN